MTRTAQANAETEHWLPPGSGEPPSKLYERPYHENSLNEAAVGQDTRPQITDCWNQRPELAEQVIAAPLFIVRAEVPAVSVIA